MKLSEVSRGRTGHSVESLFDHWSGDEPLTLYLDVDGVVTTTGYQRRTGQDRLDPAAVAVVAAPVGDRGARVVVSSTSSRG